MASGIHRLLNVAGGTAEGQFRAGVKSIRINRRRGTLQPLIIRWHLDSSFD